MQLWKGFEDYLSKEGMCLRKMSWFEESCHDNDWEIVEGSRRCCKSHSEEKEGKNRQESQEDIEVI